MYLSCLSQHCDRNGHVWQKKTQTTLQESQKDWKRRNSRQKEGQEVKITCLSTTLRLCARVQDLGQTEPNTTITQMSYELDGQDGDVNKMYLSMLLSDYSPVSRPPWQPKHLRLSTYHFHCCWYRIVCVQALQVAIGRHRGPDGIGSYLKVYLNKNWPAFIHFVLFHTI